MHQVARASPLAEEIDVAALDDECAEGSCALGTRSEADWVDRSRILDIW